MARDSQEWGGHSSSLSVSQPAPCHAGLEWMKDLQGLRGGHG
jgi:hypothetical protein